MRSFVLVVSALALTACLVDVDLSGVGYQCVDGVCPAGTTCVANRCVAPGDDPDAATPGPTFFTELTVGNIKPLSRFPLRVRLDATRIDFDEATAGGSDLYFTDENGDRLAHQIESWQPPDAAEVWVLVPNLTAAQTITMHFGGEPTDPTEAVWTDYRSVFHMTDTDDSSPSPFPVADVATTPNSGVIAGARGFEAGYIDVGENIDYLAKAAAISITGWLRPSGTPCPDTCVIFASAIAVEKTDVSRVTLHIGAKGELIIAARDTDDRLLPVQASSPEPVAIGAWQWVAAVVDLEADRLSLSIDGVQVAVTEGAGLGKTFDATPSGRVTIGVQEDLNVERLFFGELDELRVRLDAISGAWVTTQYLSQTDALLEFGAIQADPL